MAVGLNAFIPPATDGSVALNRLVDYHLEQNPDCEFAKLVDVSDSSGERCFSVKYRQLVHATHRAAYAINPGLTLPQGTRVAILTSTDTIVNIVLVLGILRSGLVPFPISPRVSVAGISHLLIATETCYLIGGGGSAIVRLIENIQSTMDESKLPFNTIRLPNFKELFPPHSEDAFELFPNVSPSSQDSIVAILHSSGSTGLPRPIAYTQECVLSSFVNQPPCYGMGGFGARVGLMALPTFHVMGFITHCFYPQFAGFTSVLFAPGTTPIVPSPDVTLRAVVRSHCTFLLTVPTFLEAWSHDTAAVCHLKKIDGIVYAGGPLIPHVGDGLVEQGVSLRAAYGATEIGAPVEFELVKRAPEDWIYIEFPDHARLEFIPQHDQDGTYELVILSTPSHKPFVINYQNERGEVGYATKDLVAPHPTKPGLWKIIGRLDDQIVLLNGEKTNPVPIENEITKCPQIQSVVMFGREQNQTGLLVELRDQSHPLPNQDSESIIGQIWPFIELANNNTSTHSRIAREAILFSEASRPLPRTPKGNVARTAALRLYADDIARMYAELGQISSSLRLLEAPMTWGNRDEAEFWLARCVAHLLGRQLNARDDLFQQGLDSLTATLLSGALKQALILSSDPKIQHVAGQVTQQTIFNHPSILQLANYLIGLTSTSSGSPSGEIEPDIMGTMIARYTQGMSTRLDDPAWLLLDSEPVKNVVVTGTTGSLGSHILAQLLANDGVQRVWAINRLHKGQGIEIAQRQRASFEDKALPVELLSHPKLTFLVCNLNESQLGLPHEDYEAIRSSATTIIHNAWQVDFNWNLQSFEPNVQGTRNLVDLALSSTWKRAPRLVFTSSISVAGLGLPGRSLNEEYITRSTIVPGFGYGESKYVAERILEAAKIAGLETCVIRLGQLSGDRASGSWSKTDWFPSMLASSLTIGYLPGAIGTVSWVPLDVAAQSLLDVCCHPAGLPPVTHIAHPKPSSWSELMRSVVQVAKIELGKQLTFVSFDEWNRRVKEIATLCGNNGVHKQLPTVKLQASVDGMAEMDKMIRENNNRGADGYEVFGAPRLTTLQCTRISHRLRDLSALDSNDVSRWICYWKHTGLFVQ